MAELTSDEFKANNKHLWKYFWSLSYTGPEEYTIWDKLAPANGILQTNIKNINSFLKEKQIEDFYDTVLDYQMNASLIIVTHNFLDWYVPYVQNYTISGRDYYLTPCLLPCKIPDIAVPKLTFNFEE